MEVSGAMKARTPAAWAPIVFGLFRPEDGLVELRALPSKAQDFMVPDDLAAMDRFTAKHRREDVYFGVAARKNRLSGRLANCSSIRTLFVDCDFKASSERETRQRLSAFRLPASLVVNSGGGLHCYWLLSMPVNLTSDADTVKALLRRLACSVGGDLSAAEPARVLRLPGTLNFKYKPPRRVSIEAAANHIYDIDDFHCLEQDTKQANLQTKAYQYATRDCKTILRRAGQYLASIPPAIQGSGGDQHTFRTCCALVREFDLTDDDAFDLLVPWNKTCDPPWSHADLRQKIANARQYGNRPIGSKLHEPPPNETVPRRRQSRSTPAPRDKDEQRSAVRQPAAHKVIEVCGGSLPQNVTDAETYLAVATQVEPRQGIYQRGGTLVRVVRISEASTAGGIRRASGALQILPTGMELLRSRLTQAVQWKRFDKKAMDWLPIDAPASVARTLCESAGSWPHTPFLSGIIEAPALRPDGTIFTQPGYDQETGLYFDAAEMEFPSIPDSPSQSLAKAALDRLLSILRGFPFVDEVSKAVAVALLITPLVRHAVRAAPLPR
jgi:hypothetical protein